MPWNRRRGFRLSGWMILLAAGVVTATVDMPAGRGAVGHGMTQLARGGGDVVAWRSGEGGAAQHKGMA